MSVDNQRARIIAPTHPGEMLREDFMPDYNLTVTALATALCISRQSVNELSPEFWLNAQQARDLWDTKQQHQVELAQIRPLPTAMAG
jgi:antitoxin HigA-1